MRYIVDKPLRYFEPWGGAKDAFNRLTCQELDILDDYLSEIPFITETAVNDFLSFDEEIWLDIIGETSGNFWAREAD